MRSDEVTITWGDGSGNQGALVVIAAMRPTAMSARSSSGSNG